MFYYASTGRGLFILFSCLLVLLLTHENVCDSTLRMPLSEKAAFYIYFSNSH